MCLVYLPELYMYKRKYSNKFNIVANYLLIKNNTAIPVIITETKSDFKQESS